LVIESWSSFLSSSEILLISFFLSNKELWYTFVKKIKKLVTFWNFNWYCPYRH
jgi:hypothetical protein